MIVRIISYLVSRLRIDIVACASFIWLYELWAGRQECVSEGPSSCEKLYTYSWRYLLRISKKKTLFCLIFRLFPFNKCFPLIFLALDMHISRCVYRPVLYSRRTECEDYLAILDSWNVTTIRNISSLLVSHRDLSIIRVISELSERIHANRNPGLYIYRGLRHYASGLVS